MQYPVYLDYAATTPCDQRVAEKMMAYLTEDGDFGNAASRSHLFGWKAEEAVENARAQVADLIGADTREIVWTSGATESDNLAIKGIAFTRKDRGRHIVTSKIEHKAVLDACAWLESQGFEISYLQPTAEGLITPDSVEAALRSDTILVSLMHVNNELGTLTDIAAIGQECRKRDIALHVDAAQSAAREFVDVEQMQIDLLSLSAHKMYGPKGIGALYVRRSPEIKVAAQIHGGGHERGMRSGTLPTHQIVGLGEAAEIAKKQRKKDRIALAELNERFLQNVSKIDGVSLNGSRQQRAPGIVNLSFDAVDGESLLMALRELAISTGSACTSATVEPSYVLTAMGQPQELAQSALRFSFGRKTSCDEIDYAVEKLSETLQNIRATKAWG